MPFPYVVAFFSQVVLDADSLPQTRRWEILRLRFRSTRRASFIIVATTAGTFRKVLSCYGIRKPHRRQDGVGFDGTSLPLHNIAGVDPVKAKALATLLPKMPAKALLHLPLEAMTPIPNPSHSTTLPPPLIFSPITRGPPAFQSPTPAKYHEPAWTQMHPTAVVFDCSIPPPPTTCLHHPKPPRPSYDGIEARLSQDTRPISPPFSPILSALREESNTSPEPLIRRESLVSDISISIYLSGS